MSLMPPGPSLASQCGYIFIFSASVVTFII